MTLFAAITISKAIAYYTIGMIGLLALILVIDIFRASARRWKVSRIKLCECEECHLLFMVDRFDTTRRYTCPRCAHVNVHRRHSKSPWGTAEEKAK